MSIVGYMVIGLFSFCCIAAGLSIMCMMFFSIRMMFSFLDGKDAFSKRTFWNPLNVIFLPELLSHEGRKYRRMIIRGSFCFLLSMAVAGSIAIILTYMSKN